MRLVAGDDALRMTPLHPAGEGLFNHEVRERLAIVIADALSRVIHAFCVEQNWQVLPQRVATPLFKVIQQVWGPVAAVLIRIMVHGARLQSAIRAEGLLENGKIVVHGLRVEEIDHPALAAGCGAFDLHGGLGTDNKWLTCVGFEFLHVENGAGFLLRDLGASKTPAGACGHVHVQIQPLALADDMVEHLHPCFAEVGDVFILVSLCAIDGDDVDAAHAGLFVTFHLARQVCLVHRTAEPPPVGMRTAFACGLRPDGLSIGRSAKRDEKCY